MATKKSRLDSPKTTAKPAPTTAQKQQLAALEAVEAALSTKRRGEPAHHKRLVSHHRAMPYLAAALVVSLGLLAFAVIQAPATPKFTAPRGDMAAEAQAAVDTLEQSAGQLDTANLDDDSLSENSLTQ